MDESSRKARPEPGPEGQPQDGEAVAWPRLIAPVRPRARVAPPPDAAADAAAPTRAGQQGVGSGDFAEPSVADVLRALHRVLQEEGARVVQAAGQTDEPAEQAATGDSAAQALTPAAQASSSGAPPPEPSVADVLRELHAGDAVAAAITRPPQAMPLTPWPEPAVADVLGELHRSASAEPAPSSPPGAIHAPWPEPSVADVLEDLHRAATVAPAPVATPSHIEAVWPQPSVADVLGELHATATAAEPPVRPQATPNADVQRPAHVPVAARIPTIETTQPSVARSAPPSLPRPSAADAARAEIGSEIQESQAQSSPPPLAEPRQSGPEDMRARIIPFVPRNPRPQGPPPPEAAQVYARPTVPFFARPDEALQPWTPPPAQPPPPDGYRGSAVPRVPQLAPPGADGRGDALVDGIPAWWREIAWGRVVRVTAKWLGILLVAYATMVLTLVVAYRWIDPPMSSLMLSQRLFGSPVTQRWVPLERISPNLQHAVILSEDGQFCRHRGVDWGELKEAIEQSIDGPTRGGSTISMQLVKNLFLWSYKSYIRKAVEIPLALLVERVWPKARVLEIYLNIAEWGPGIFGAEAAARYHFGKSAANLTVREASLLAVSLPNPIERQAGRPGAGTQRLADNLQARMRRTASVAACGRSPKGTALGAADRR